MRHHEDDVPGIRVRCDDDAGPGLDALMRGYVPAHLREIGNPVLEIVHDPEAASLLLAIRALGTDAATVEART